MRVQKDSNRVLDRIDLHILSILQADGRIVMKDLAERVGLSLTPCNERVKRMEPEIRAGVRAVPPHHPGDS
jgi:Lrp/AsnC family leucine-responsive transcriptional regulator